MLHAAIGLAGGTLLIAASVLCIFSAHKRPAWVRVLLSAVAVGIAWFPYDGLFLVEYLRALSGDLSITSMFLLSLTILSHFTPVPALTERASTRVLLLALGAALLLYPMELGLTRFTPYTLGYGSNIFYALLLLTALAAWRFHQPLILWSLTLACAAFQMGLLESRNLWDYLIDPVIVFFTPFWLLGWALVRAFRTRPAARPVSNSSLIASDFSHS